MVKPVYVPFDPLIIWWGMQHRPHERIGCICCDGGVCASMESLARRLGVSRSTVFRRVRDSRLEVGEADRWAITLGVHPKAIWVDWDRLEVCQGWRCDK